MQIGLQRLTGLCLPAGVGLFIILCGVVSGSEAADMLLNWSRQGFCGEWD